MLWAQVLFVFLALPGILLAAYLARYAVETLVENQRREFALLRARGASGQQVLGIVATMSLAVGLAGSLLGILIGAATTGVLFGMQPFALSNWPVWGGVLVWCVLSGLVISALATFLPARRLLREEVIGERRVAWREGAAPLGARLYLDVAALVASAIVFRITELNGFHPVLNAEGNPTLSLSFYTFLAPLLFWIGSILLLNRVGIALLKRSSSGLGSGSGRSSGKSGATPPPLRRGGRPR